MTTASNLLVDQSSEQPPTAIEVCMGPNCSAGGAAILEIEELILEDGRGKFRIVEGGCRDLCSMGPNVYCKSTHFPKIKSPEGCRKVATHAGIKVSKAESSLEIEATSKVGSMMLKKAERLRWTVLREAGNSTKKRSSSRNRTRIDQWSQRLEEASRLEISAARSTGCIQEGTERAQRRLKRLRQFLESERNAT